MFSTHHLEVAAKSLNLNIAIISSLLLEQDRVVSTKEAAKILNHSRPTLDKLAATGKIKKIKIKGCSGFTLSSIKSYQSSGLLDSPLVVTSNLAA